jgi:hypothetical protein
MYDLIVLQLYFFDLLLLVFDLLLPFFFLCPLG